MQDLELIKIRSAGYNRFPLAHRNCASIDLRRWNHWIIERTEGEKRLASDFEELLIVRNQFETDAELTDELVGKFERNDSNYLITKFVRL